MVEVFRATDAAAAGKRVAVCMVGGVRALTLPNVYKSIGDNLLGNLKDTGVGVDLFFLGSLTPRGHNGGAASADTISQPDDPRLVAGLDYLESKVSTFAKKRIVPDSTCGAVADVMADQGRGVRSSAPGEAPRYDGPPVLPTSLCTDRQFYKSAWFLQMMWVDACFADVEKHAEAHNLTYDLVVRARPDTGFFEPLDWNAAAASPEFSVARNFPTLPARPPTSTNRVWDWFFTAPFHYIPKFRAGTVGWYVKYDSAANEFRDNLNGKHGLPDFGAFANYSFTTVVRRPFPVTIVRTASQAQCNFFEGYKKEGFEQVGSRLFGDCEQKQRDAYWGL
ncbi:unnamed protein product [Amoebophrya sp. A120]|nr:unnamed protein product [Amoebophrya sp. A120]|eukprot:GSA120T00014911001.1